MSQYNLPTEHETKMLDEYFVNNLIDLNKMLNIDIHSLNEHHFYNAINIMFPTHRTEQLFNNGNNIAYLNYIESLKKQE